MWGLVQAFGVWGEGFGGEGFGVWGFCLGFRVWRLGV